MQTTINARSADAAARMARERAFAARFSDGAHRRDAARARQAAADVAAHEMTVAPVRAFHFARRGEDGRSSPFHSFSFTWTPGCVAITGDIGPLTIEHGAALASFEKGMAWLARGDDAYLLSKTAAGQTYDIEETLDLLVRLANEGAFGDVRARTHAARECRAALEAAEPGEEAGIAEDFDPGRLEIAQASAIAWPGRVESLPDDLPEGFELWYRLFYASAGEHAESDPNAIFTARGRRAVKAAIRRVLQDGEEAAYRLMTDCGLDDTYPSRSHSGSTRARIAAARYAAETILAAARDKDDVGA